MLALNVILFSIQSLLTKTQVVINWNLWYLNINNSNAYNTCGQERQLWILLDFSLWLM